MRRAKYVLLTNERETQQLRFKVGSENALMTVGDLIEVQDSHRNEARYGGRTTYQYSFWGLNVFEIDQDPAIPPITGVTVSPYGDIMTVTTDTGAIRSGGIYVTYSPPTYNPSVIMVNGTAGGWATTNRTFITRPQSATPRIYRVLSLSEDEPGVYEVAAIEHDASKWSAIEDPSETGAAFAYPSDVWPPP
jgi:predicted phage tail protein